MWLWPKNTDEPHIVLYDASDTRQKIRNKLPQFVSDVCGKVLETIAAQHATNVFLRNVKQAVGKFEKRAKVPRHGELVAIKALGICKQ